MSDILTLDMIRQLTQRGGGTITSVAPGAVDNEVIIDGWRRNYYRITMKSKENVVQTVTLYRGDAAAPTTQQIGGPFTLPQYATIHFESNDPRVPLFRTIGASASDIDQLYATSDDATGVDIDVDYYDTHD